MAKQVSIKMLEEETKLYSEHIDIPVTIQGQTEELNIKLYPFFSPTKVRDLVNSLIEFFKAAEKEKVKVDQLDEDDLIGFFIVKYFTNLKFTNSKKASTIYKEFKIAQNSSVFKTLLQAFPEESVKSVMERIYEVRDFNAKFQNMITNVQKEMQELPLENKEILFPNKSDVSNVLADK
ncbi:hypothetical protein BAOM_3121 [Peribacillus asahii]|uniref:Uncharacterized protein n=1 Tax=Peribacillus asahii TaxID=228899 RepID=A0A3Q9RPF6_9BACI|nr:hypothetical protein [Peribacillus asahii]AZV43730.1 hypothetical protein BAOM_3121 [Peribacillus asahii]